MVRLHLGCGRKIFPGWINIDGYDDHADLKADIRKLPFPDNHADVIAAIHVFEHFPVWEVTALAKEWLRVLKPGGSLILELPDLDKCLTLLLSQDEGEQTCGLYGLYGDWGAKRPEMIHNFCYTQKMLQNCLNAAGFRAVGFFEPEFHIKRRDMKAVAVK